jgi:hypothetical protein
MKISRVGIRLWLCVLLAQGLLAACQRSPKSDLYGEWHVNVDDGGPQESGGDPDGIFVFHPAILCYCDEVSQPPEGAIIGRGYFRYERFDLPTRSGRTRFAEGAGADMTEEMVGQIANDSTATISAAGMSGLVFLGSFTGDTIKGSWAFLAHGDTVSSGRFAMWRAVRTIHTDSALTRSRRGVRMWRTTGFPIPDGPTDTVELVTPR